MFEYSKKMFEPRTMKEGIIRGLEFVYVYLFIYCFLVSLFVCLLFVNFFFALMFIILQDMFIWRLLLLSIWTRLYWNSRTTDLFMGVCRQLFMGGAKTAILLVYYSEYFLKLYCFVGNSCCLPPYGRIFKFQNLVFRVWNS